MSIQRTASRMARGVWRLPKTLFLNFRALPFDQAKKLPIIVMGRTRISGIRKGAISIEGPVRTGMIRIGAQKTAKRGLPVNKSSYVISDKGGKIRFQGAASFGEGTAITASGGSITFGDKFSCNVNCFFYSEKAITFGKDVLLGWNINVRDNDGHPIYDQGGERVNPEKEIVFGDHIWVASYVDIMKGVTLADGTIVGTRSLVVKSNPVKNAVIAGQPARLVREERFWEHEESDRKRGNS